MVEVYQPAGLPVCKYCIWYREGADEYLLTRTCAFSDGTETYNIVTGQRQPRPSCISERMGRCGLDGKNYKENPSLAPRKLSWKERIFGGQA